MKFSLAFLLVISLTGTINSSPLNQTQSLADDLDDFLSLLPLEKIIPLVQEYLKNDKEVQKVLEYMKTEDFKKLVLQIESIPDVVNFLKYLKESGLDVIDLVNKLNDLIELPPMKPITRVAISGGIAGLVADIKSLLPYEEIKAMYYDKLKTSEDFKNLIERLKSPKLQAIVDTLAANKEVQYIVKTLKAHKVDVDVLFDLISKVLGIKFPKSELRRSVRSLHDDFEDFVALVPLDKVIPIVTEYMQNDKEVQHVIEYVQSQDFKNLVTEVESIEDVLAFYNYLQQSGLDVYKVVNKLHELMGLPPLVPRVALARITGGVAGLIADIKAVLPVEKFRALYKEKLTSSPEFKSMIERLRSPKFQAIINKLFTNDTFLHLLKKAKEHGVHVDVIADLLVKLLGIKFPGHRLRRAALGLEEDLADFLALIPQNEIMHIVVQYLEHDKDVQKAVEYMQSAEFRQLVKIIEEMDDVKNFYKYIQDSGLDIYGAVNKLHDFIGLPPLIQQRLLRIITGGLNGLIQDIKAILPLEEIKALYYQKMETSPAFKQLVQRLNSPKFQAVVDKLLANKEFQEILKAAREAGIDLEKIADLLSTIFGLKFPSASGRSIARSLYVDIHDFLNLLPKEKIAEIFSEYLAKDKEVQAAYQYIRTPEFRKLLSDIEEIDDVSAFLHYLDESGLEIYYLVNEIHKIIGLPSLKPYLTSERISGGVSGLINDILAILPVDKIKALYNEKMEKSPRFKNLVDRLRSPKFQAVIDTLMANQEFQNIIKKAKAAGIDLKATANFLSRVLGLHFPESRQRRSVQSDLEDFVMLLPVEEITKIGIKYLMNDADVQEAVKYIRTDEFKNLLMELQEEQDVSDFLKYLNDSGVNVYNIVNFLNDFLGVPHYPRPVRISRAGETGVQGMLNEIRAILPHDKIHALYEEKLKTSEDFRAFIHHFKAPQMQAIIDRLVVNKKFIELGYQAHKHGISIDHIVTFLQEVFGLKFPEVPFPPKPASLYRAGSELRDDLAEFLDLLPVDKITKTVLEYTFYDKETKETFQYIRSEDFKNIIRTLDKIPEYNEMLKSLDAAGLDIYETIEIIHKFIGLDDKHPSMVRKSLPGKPGVSGLIEKLKELLPYPQIKQLYYFKLENSKAFADFVQLIKSDNFQTVTNTLFANENFQQLLREAKAHGVDLKAISDFFARVFGIKTPPGVIDP
ncbi:uncharacterized protein LOC107048468 [Diachasma alloeum]|uniref:uncharacterized protein LOC107048468 n=1 Tax=Diachasma alloeum TaxID=454923 RepID=UPI0007384346|nr:uncharacterized protein LOC107048468 [Diachasma alloeum]